MQEGVQPAEHFFTNSCKMEQYEAVPEMEVKVRSAVQYKSPDDETYCMGSSPKGYAVVINNENFDFEKPREGSEKDFTQLQQLLGGLGYDVLPYQDLTAEKMLDVFANFVEMPYHFDVDSCVVAISTHGSGKSLIQGTDGAFLDLDSDITPMFNNSNCKALKNKPKIFFIQACRGGQRDDGVDARPMPAKGTDVLGAIQKEKTPSWSDMMIVHSTIPGYVSTRHKCEGSWFMQSMVKTFMEDAWEKDLETMMKKVTKCVMKCKTYLDEKQSPEVTLRGWTKSLYFNPGQYQE